MVFNNIHEMVCCLLRCQTFDFVWIVESILIGVTAFPNTSSFTEFVGSALATHHFDTPKCSSDVQTKFSMFLKRNFSPEEMDDELKILIFWSYHLLMKIPEIERCFQSAQEKRFLMHLILQHDFILRSAG